MISNTRVIWFLEWPSNKQLVYQAEKDHLSWAKIVYIYFYIDSIYFNLTYSLYTYFLSMLTQHWISGDLGANTARFLFGHSRVANL